MEPSRYFAPRFGIVTLLTAILMTVGLAILWQQADSSLISDEWHAVGVLAGIGMFYGMIGWACWTLAGVANVYLRSILRAALAFAATFIELRFFLADGVKFEFFLRYAINFGGLMVAQSLLFWLLAIPAWNLGRSNRSTAPRHRFTIGETLVLTLAVALLLALGKHYAPPVDPTTYWGWLCALWMLVPLTSAASATAILHGSKSRRMIAASTAVILAASVAIAFGIADSRQSAGGGTSEVTRMIFYAAIVVASMASIALLSLSGRIDRAAVPDSAVSAQDS
jgi:hypothetical protein